MKPLRPKAVRQRRWLPLARPGDGGRPGAAAADAETANGLGWSVIELQDNSGGSNLFTIVLDIDPDYADALGGFAILLQIMEQYQQSNEKVAALLDTTWVLNDTTGFLEPVFLDPEWSFEHKDVDYLDLRLIRAENYFFLADYELSLEEALALADEIPEFEEEVNWEDFNLATIEGRTALMNLLDALDELI